MVRLPLLQQRDKQDEQHDNNPLSEELWELCLCGLRLSSCLLLSAERTDCKTYKPMRFFMTMCPSHSTLVNNNLSRQKRHDLVVNISEFFVAYSWRSKIVHSNSDCSTSNKHTKIMLLKCQTSRQLSGEGISHHTYLANWLDASSIAKSVANAPPKLWPVT